MFDAEQFAADCRAALSERDAQGSVREIVARAAADPASVIKQLGAPERGGISPLYRSDTLTILNVIWAPRMTLYPHNHRMWAVIGIYGGREDNIFWRRVPDSNTGQVEAAGAKSLSDGDAVQLGPDIIHSVTNPINQLTGAIHVYGGDFFRADRSEWDPESLTERPCDVQQIVRLFEEYDAAGTKELNAPLGQS